MAVTPDYRERVEQQLAAVVPALKTKSMFGGVGVYSHSLFFALLDNDRLYFKVDESNRGDFEALGMGPFRPFPDPSYVMQYYEVPTSILDDPIQLGAWVAKAIDVAQRKGKRRSANRQRRPPRPPHRRRKT